MEKLSSHLPVLANGVVLSPSKSATLSPKQLAKVKRVWFRLVEMYGRTWESHHGDDGPSPAWVMRINELSEEQLNRGLLALSSTAEKFYPVPDLATFTNYCTRGANVSEKFCAWPVFGGRPVGIPDMNQSQRARYERAEYDNVELHRVWILAQPYADKDAPEASVLKALYEWERQQRGAA